MLRTASTTNSSYRKGTDINLNLTVSYEYFVDEMALSSMQLSRRPAFEYKSWLNLLLLFCFTFWMNECHLAVDDENLNFILHGNLSNYHPVRHLSKLIQRDVLFFIEPKILFDIWSMMSLVWAAKKKRIQPMNDIRYAIYVAPCARELYNMWEH